MSVNPVNNKEYIYKLGSNKKNTRETEEETSRPSGDLDKNAFLHLLTTQLANQDPLDPMDDREFIAQLAQFSSLEQMTELNKNSLEVIDALDALNLNEIQANTMLLKELMAIKELLEDKIGLETEEKPEEVEDLNEDLNKIDQSEDVRSKVMAYRLKK